MSRRRELDSHRKQLVEIRDDDLAGSTRAYPRKLGGPRLDADNHSGRAFRIGAHPGDTITADHLQAPSEQTAGVAVAAGILDDDAPAVSRHDAPRQFVPRDILATLHRGRDTRVIADRRSAAWSSAVWWRGSMEADCRDCSLW